MHARKLQLAFSLLSFCVAVTVLAIALEASVVRSDEIAWDLSRGRDVVLGVSAFLVVLSLYLSVRSWRLLRIVGLPDADAEVEVDTAVGDKGSLPEEGTPEGAGVISTLSADESTLYQMVADSGGEILQMHIVSSGAFSKAKVTRLLDKLEKKGVVVRERHGMTNRIRILR